MYLVIRKRRYKIATLVQGQNIWKKRGPERASVMVEEDGNVYDDDGILINTISYNGRVWDDKDWPESNLILESNGEPPSKITLDQLYHSRERIKALEGI